MKFTRQNTLFKNIAIVQNIVQNENFADKNELVAFLSAKHADVHLEVTCICDKEFIYATINDIPGANVICTCGQKIIEYNNLL